MSNNVANTLESGNCSTMPAVTSLVRSPNKQDDVSGRSVDGRCLDAQRSVHSQYVLQLLQLQRRAGFLCDITIHVRDRSFKAHKPLLAACSLYFRSLFAEASLKDSTALNLNILTPTGFEVLLDYIYSGSLSITAENSTEVLSAATCLQMNNVVETCLNFMRSSFRMSKATIDSSLPPGGGDKVVFPPSQIPAIFQATNKPDATQPTVNQENLKIISTASINEAEFKSMISKTLMISSGHTTTHVQDPQPYPIPNGQPPSNDPLPSTSELQSVLPLLVTKEPRQPTIEEVQLQLANLPPHTWGSKHPSLLSTQGNPLVTSVGQVNDPLLRQQSLLGYQALSVTSDPMNSVLKVMTTSSPGATSAPELNSGNAPHTKPAKESSTVAVISDSSTEMLSDQDNHLEISDDEDDVSDAWSAKRSDSNFATDLSCTPCSTAAPLVTSHRAPVTSSNENNRISSLTPQPSDLSTSLVGDVRRSVSLPSSPSSLKSPRKMRTNSLGGASELISYELASSAVQALLPPSGSIVTKAIRTSLIPPKSIDTSQRPSQPIKVELPSDDDLTSEPGGFPLQENQLRETTLADDAIGEGSFVTSSRSGSPCNICDVKESDEDSVLDLSLPQRVRATRESFDSSEEELRHLAADQRVDYGQTESDMTSLNMRNSAFSRKPRRTTGGQTCTWPGCGRLFRHKNIYEEHQRLHELGIPVSQLRKCYMGARVKKTVREQLEELRTNDNNDEDHKPGGGRNKKRKNPFPVGQEIGRKRVTVKDRIGSFQGSSSVQQNTPQISYAQYRGVPRFPINPGQVVSYQGPSLVRPPQDVANRFPQINQSRSSHAHNQNQYLPQYSAPNPPQLVSPVEQTLALLGIPTPVRRGESTGSNGGSGGLTDLSMDQFRRRLALRETSAGGHPPLGGVINQQIAKPGTVMGLHPGVQGVYQHLPTRYQTPHGSTNGATPRGIPRPVEYPGLPVSRGAKCS